MIFFNSSSRAAVLLLALSLLVFPPIVLSHSWVTPAYGESQRVSAQTAEHSPRPTSQGFGATPSSGPPGTRITVSGCGFHDFTPVESISLGGLNILGNRTISTDGERGCFEVDGLVVPGLDPGIRSLVITVGTGNRETTATGTFEITAPTEAPARATPAAAALAPLGDDLARVFHFDNRTKSWSFFDPRPEFADVNTLREMVEGQVYWVKVTQSVTALLNGEQRQLSCSNEGTLQEDCWNLLVW